MKRLALVALVWSQAARADRCALLVASQPEPDAAALAQLRASLAQRCELVDDAAVKAALEGFERPAPPEERVRAALARAHARMRRFDAAGVREALEEARAPAAELGPTVEGRQLHLQLALARVELALVENDADEQLRAMRLALAVEPDLKLEGRASPAMVALLGRARSEQARAPRHALAIASEPPGARVWAGGWRGETPLELELPDGPALVWLARAGFQTRAHLIEVAAGARLDSMLPPLSEHERLKPLIDAVRQSFGPARREPALALAAALGVTTLVVLDPGVPPVEYATDRAAPSVAVVAAPPAPAPSPPPRRPWYKKAWPWVLIVGGAAAIATAVGVGVAYGSSSSLTLSCCR